MTELDDLYTEAKAAYASIHPPTAPFLGKYLDPANWKRTRGIALIHKETQTLLGNYGEFVHRTEQGCRKLVREDLVMRVSATEEVSGDWWLAKPQTVEIQEPITRVTLTLDVVLDGLQIHAPKCPVVVTLDDRGHVREIRLALHTTFAQIDPEYPKLVFFPAGVDLREEMTRECKAELFKMIKEEEGC